MLLVQHSIDSSSSVYRLHSYTTGTNEKPNTWRWCICCGFCIVQTMPAHIHHATTTPPAPARATAVSPVTILSVSQFRLSGCSLFEPLQVRCVQRLFVVPFYRPGSSQLRQSGFICHVSGVGRRVGVVVVINASRRAAAWILSCLKRFLPQIGDNGTNSPLQCTTENAFPGCRTPPSPSDVRTYISLKLAGVQHKGWREWRASGPWPAS